jgi:hypothetical protein
LELAAWLTAPSRAFAATRRPRSVPKLCTAMRVSGRRRLRRSPQARPFQTTSPSPRRSLSHTDKPQSSDNGASDSFSLISEAGDLDMPAQTSKRSELGPIPERVVAPTAQSSRGGSETAAPNLRPRTGPSSYSRGEPDPSMGVIGECRFFV